MGDSRLAEELRRRGIRDERVLAAIASLSRADFVRPQMAAFATGDFPLPIGHGQTISQPYVVAFMTQALALSGGERVLEVGTGSGYQTAVRSRLCREVYSIEIVPELAREAAERLKGLANVYLREGDGYFGWPEAAPFGAIVLTAAPPKIPEALLRQLEPGGRLLGPIGEWEQDLTLVRKTRGEELQSYRLLPVRFVPMKGASAAAPGDSHQGRA
ncbi:MAG: protein-L-isoaspartate(D-aspartate) O-methyltransferase [Myxococcales bacterium]|nr:protein-L-isoaspartate(D-aspartate) O-methyltransferase [Myxococcales bacterium]